MSEGQKTSTDPLNQDPPIGIILLRPIAPTLKITDWCGFKIAGVPLLLRNILTVQGGGLKRILLLDLTQSSLDETFRHRILGDQRINIFVDWVSKTGDLEKLLNNGYPILLMEGSVLYNKEEIRSATQGNIQQSFKSLDKRDLIKLLENPETVNAASMSDISKTRMGDFEASNSFRVGLLPGREHSKINSKADLISQHEQLLNTCGLNNDSFMDRLITRSISRRLTRLFLDTPFSPNQITFFSLIIGLVSAGFFFQGTYLTGMIGAGLLLFSAWIDCTDGEIARLKFMESELGSKLDLLSDNIVHFAVFFSIGMGLYYSTGQAVYKTLGAFAVLGSLISFILLSTQIVEKKSMAGPDSSVSTEKNFADKLANRDFTYFLLLMALAGRLDIFIIITALGANAFALYLVYFKTKSSLPLTGNR